MPGPPKFTPAEESIRDTLNVRPKGEDVDGHPFVAPPPGFRPDPNIIGRPDFIKHVMNLLRIAPELRGQTKNFSQAPTPGLIDMYGAFNVDPNTAFLPTSVLGATDPHDTIFVQPNNPAIYDDPEFLGDHTPITLAHEASHAVGYKHASGVPKKMEDLMREVLLEQMKKSPARSK